MSRSACFGLLLCAFTSCGPPALYAQTQPAAGDADHVADELVEARGAASADASVRGFNALCGRLTTSAPPCCAYAWTTRARCSSYGLSVLDRAVNSPTR
jgi:hypothetical protein